MANPFFNFQLINGKSIDTDTERRHLDFLIRIQLKRDFHLLLAKVGNP